MIHKHTHTHMHARVHKDTHGHTHKDTHTHARTHSHTHTSTHTIHWHTQTCTCVVDTHFCSSLISAFEELLRPLVTGTEYWTRNSVFGAAYSVFCYGVPDSLRRILIRNEMKINNTVFFSRTFGFALSAPWGWCSRQSFILCSGTVFHPTLWFIIFVSICSKLFIVMMKAVSSLLVLQVECSHFAT